MPVYDFQKPCACPVCGELSPRVVCLAPELFQLDKNTSEANERNEKAQHEPAFSTKDQRERDERHNKFCGCSGKKAGKRTMLLTARGEKLFPTARPWMISH